MKTLSYACISLVAIALTFSSCSKKSSSNPTPSGTVSSMKLTVNGTDLNFNDCEETEFDTNNGFKNTVITGYMVTNGKPGDVKFVVYIVHDPATLKAGQTYVIEPSNVVTDNVIFFYWINSTDQFSSQSGNPHGSVTITAATSTTISGTFSGKLFDPGDLGGINPLYTITNGSFTAKVIK